MKLNLQKEINEAKFTELGSSVISLLVFIPCVFLLDQSDHSSKYRIYPALIPNNANKEDL